MWIRIAPSRTGMAGIGVKRLLLIVALVVLLIIDALAAAQTVATIFLTRLFAGLGHHGGARSAGWLVLLAFFLGLTAVFIWLTIATIKALRRWHWHPRGS